MIFNICPAVTSSPANTNAAITMNAKIALMQVINAVMGSLSISV